MRLITCFTIIKFFLKKEASFGTKLAKPHIWSALKMETLKRTFFYEYVNKIKIKTKKYIYTKAKYIDFFLHLLKLNRNH